MTVFNFVILCYSQKLHAYKKLVYYNKCISFN